MKNLKESLSEKDYKDFAGKPVYCSDEDVYGIIKYETIGRWANIPFLVGVFHQNGGAVNFEYNIFERNLKRYKI